MGVLPKHISEEIRVVPKLPMDSSFEDHIPASTSSFNNASYCYKDFPFKKRLMITEDPPKSPKRLRFSTCQEEEDYYTQKVEELFEKMRKEYAPKVELATKKATKICPPVYIEDNTNKEKKKKKKKKRKIQKTMPMVIIRNEITEQLKRFIDEMNGSDLTLVIQKRLFESDLKPGQNRLNMPMKQLQTLEFLKPDEKIILDNKEEGIKVGLVGPTLQMYKEPMMLKMWDMERTSNYVLMNNWSHFVKDYENDLKVNTTVQVWSFRRNNELCFALVIVGDEGNGVA